ncbi:MAG: hypothetical protein LBD28_06750 [Tannerellaceae bacterium]|jgi:hypothetical protein|nr:hypothetical protein [Tannerellaceae bacterium]
MDTRGNKTKLRLYGFLLCMTLTFAITSCYGPELDFINDKLVTLENRLDSLKAKLETKKFIQSVTAIERGFRITFDDLTYYDITSGINGERGENGTSWIIDEYGMWRYSTATGGYMDSGFRAVPNDGNDGAPGRDGQAAPSPKVSPDGFWIMYEWSSIDSTYHEVLSKIPASMAPYVRYYPNYVALFVPRIDSISYSPPRIVNDSIALPFYAEDPLIISFKGYGHMTGDTIKMLDNLSFKYWQVSYTSTIGAWGGTKAITQDTLITIGLPPFSSTSNLVVVYAANQQISTPRLALQDSKRDQNDYFSIDPPVRLTNELLTKVYYDTLYYAKMNYITSVSTSAKQGNIQYFLVNNNTERSIASYPIHAQSPSIPAIPVQTIGGSSQATKADKLISDTRYRYFKVDSAASAIGLTFNESEYVFDYFITDTCAAANSIVNIGATKKTFTFKSSSGLWADTAAYQLVVHKLLMNGSIQIDTVAVSTRDSIRDLIAYPYP